MLLVIGNHPDGTTSQSHVFSLTEMSGMMEVEEIVLHSESIDSTLQMTVPDVTALQSASEDSMVTARSEADTSQQVPENSQTQENSPIPTLPVGQSLDDKENEDASGANNISANSGNESGRVKFPDRCYSIMLITQW